MAHIPPSLFTPLDSLATALCMIAALYWALLPQFTGYWEQHRWWERLAMSSVLGAVAFGSPFMVMDTTNLVSPSFEPVMISVLPWACLAAYLVAVGAGYARRAYAEHHPTP
jgi:hypothetical protein